MYYNLHTHKFSEGNADICAIVNIRVSAYPPLEAAKGGNLYSIGIHPWHIKKENIEKELDLIEKYASLPNIKAIGECGLDKLCETDFELQKEVFLSQISISEKYGKPLILHCVKSFDEMILFKKNIKPQQTWIIHGFRGKPQQAKQLIEQGFFLSFGFRYNEETLQNIPIDRLFLETDDSDQDIQTVYKNAVKVLGIPEERLVKQIEKNITFV